MTLTFLLRRTASKKKAPSAKELTSLLADVAKDPHVLEYGATLQIPCLHAYAVESKTPTVERLEPASKTLSYLKGRDATVARAALEAGIDTSLAYCLVVEQDGVWTGEHLKRAPSEKALAQLRKLITRPIGSEEEELARAQATDEVSAPDDAPPRRLVGAFPRSATFLGVGLYSAVHYYGNEAGEGYFYVSAMLELTFAIPTASMPKSRDVVHAKWGRGRVVSSTIENGERKLRIRFASGEEKTLLERFLTYA